MNGEKRLSADLALLVEQLDRWSPKALHSELDRILGESRGPDDTSSIEAQIDMCVEVEFRFAGIESILRGATAPKRASSRSVDHRALGAALKPVVELLESVRTALLRKQQIVLSARQRWQDIRHNQKRVSEERRRSLETLAMDEESLLQSQQRINDALVFLRP
jgi:hypothetical protein